MVPIALCNLVILTYLSNQLFTENSFNGLSEDLFTKKESTVEYLPLESSAELCDCTEMPAHCLLSVLALNELQIHFLSQMPLMNVM